MQGSGTLKDVSTGLTEGGSRKADVCVDRGLPVLLGITISFRSESGGGRDF